MKTPMLYAGDLDAFDTPIEQAQSSIGCLVSLGVSFWLIATLCSVLAYLLPFLSYTVPAVIGGGLLLLVLVVVGTVAYALITEFLLKLTRSDLSKGWARLKGWVRGKVMPRARLIAACFVGGVVGVYILSRVFDTLRGFDYAGMWRAWLAAVKNSEYFALMMARLAVLRDSEYTGLVGAGAVLLVVGFFLFRASIPYYRSALIPFYKSARAFSALVLRRTLKLKVPEARPVPMVLEEATGDAEIFVKLVDDVSWRGLSSEERFRIYRDALGFARSRLLRVWIYRERAKLYKEVRQENARPKE